MDTLLLIHTALLALTAALLAVVVWRVFPRRRPQTQPWPD